MDYREICQKIICKSERFRSRQFRSGKQLKLKY